MKTRHSHLVLFAFLWALALIIVPHADAWAQEVKDITDNVVASVNGLPGFISALSYLFGLLLGVSAILKTKDHVENPNNTPISVPAIRFLAGGALFALPTIYEAAQGAIAGAGTTFTIDELDEAPLGLAEIFAKISSLGFNINNTFENIIDSVGGIEGVIQKLSYLLGLIIMVMGVFKLKDHVENPNNTPLREGMTNILTAGALFALPTLFKAMRSLIDGGHYTSFDPLNDFASVFQNALGAVSVLFTATNFGQDFNGLLGYIMGSVNGLPVFVSFLGYVLGMLLGVAGALKIREHINNPGNVPLREGLNRLVTGGMLFALPTLYSVLYNMMGGGSQVAGIINNFFNTGGFFDDIYSSCAADGINSLKNSTVGALFGFGGENTGTISTLLCNMTLGSTGLPAFLMFVSYLIGIILAFWGILKLKNYIENPAQTEIWEVIKRFAAAGAFFAMPVMLSVFANTMGMGIRSYTTTGADYSGLSNGGLDTMVVLFILNLYAPGELLFKWFAYIAGTIFIMIGVSRLLKSSQDGPRGPGGTGTIMTFLIGGALLSFHPMISAFSTTFFGGSIETALSLDTGSHLIKTKSALSYTTGLNSDEAAHVNAVITATLQFLFLVGTVSFLRGMFMFREVAEGGNASMMAAMTHMIGGIIAINIGPFLSMVQTTLGITNYGIKFS